MKLDFVQWNKLKQDYINFILSQQQYESKEYYLKNRKMLMKMLIRESESCFYKTNTLLVY